MTARTLRGNSSLAHPLVFDFSDLGRFQLLPCIVSLTAVRAPEMTSAAEDDEILAHRFITKEESLLTTLKSFVAYSNAVKSSQPLDEWCATHHFAFRRFIVVARCAAFRLSRPSCASSAPTSTRSRDCRSSRTPTRAKTAATKPRSHKSV